MLVVGVAVVLSGVVLGVGVGESVGVGVGESDGVGVGDEDDVAPDRPV
ncbi:MAG: hypothetical protein ACRDRO_15130 [Pseudonocardiaceae bacterium]